MEKKVSIEFTESEWLRIVNALRNDARTCQGRGFDSLARTNRRIAGCIADATRSDVSLF